ncbi:MAG: DUF134 domain-containing protein [Desulfitobacteriaceae bacterium]|nr:DUF134 domain-containing protein [Desulfitobacteriaceae bacterium]MDI6916052.1 DUF134 domain-containing protein [Desulfitobacteriaceae bacterium]
MEGLLKDLGRVREWDLVKEWVATDGRVEMPRPQKHRWVESRPCATHFKPQGIPWCELEEVILTIEEYEAVRLKDAEGLEQEECARQMRISRPTFVRLIQSARNKIALALTQGKGLRIEGGHHKFYGEHGKCRRNGEACRRQRSEVGDDNVRRTLSPSGHTRDITNGLTDGKSNSPSDAGSPERVPDSDSLESVPDEKE